MTIFARNLNSIGRALGDATRDLSMARAEYNGVYALRDDDVIANTVYLDLLGPGSEAKLGKVIRTLEASSTETADDAYVKDIAEQFERQIRAIHE